jgi:hypothetical protein
MIRPLLLLTLICAGAQAATVRVQCLLIEGDSAAGLVVSDLRQVSQNERGEVAVGGNSNEHNHTLWAGFPGLWRVVARNGSPAPDGGGFSAVSSSTLVVPIINDQGDVAFLASEGNTGMYTSVGGVTGKLARHGDAVPGIPGATFSMNFGNVMRPFFSASGLFQFLTRMDGSTTSADNMALWGGAAGTPQMIAREGGGIPGLPGLSFPSINFVFEAATANTAGQTILCTSLSGAGVVAGFNDNAVLVGGAGGFTIALRGGDPAVAFGLPPDATFSAVGDNWPARINDFGEILFFSALEGTGVSGTLTTGNHTSIWKGPPGELRMIARRADAAPGIAGATLLLSTSLTPVLDHLALSSSGDAAFISTLAGAGITTANDTALYIHLAGSNQLVAREGAQAPGLPAGVVFNNIAAAQGWRFAINSNGQLAILADLTGTGVTNANDAAVYFWTAEDGLMLVAREGGTVETSPGVLQTITNIEFNATHGDDDGGPRNFNSRGQLAFTATLDGNASIMRATIVTPASYELVTATTHSAGGGLARSGQYSANTDTSDSGGIATGANPVLKCNFIGQLYDPVLLTPGALPASVAENATTQLSTAVTMDDDTFSPLAAGIARWSGVSGPVTAIHAATHIATAGTVYQNETAVLRADHAGLSATLNVPVLNTNTDDFAQYSGDAIDDAWQVQYFGLPPNSDAAPTANPDFDGQDNRFEFLAGNHPNDASSFFQITPMVPAPGAFSLVINKVVPGTQYTVLKTSDLTAPLSWVPLTSFTPPAVQTNVIIEDPAPAPERGFYKVSLQKP